MKQHDILINSITDLAHLGLISISGMDAPKLLQGQLTCDITEMSHSKSRLGAHCNREGRIISLFRIFWFKNQYLLQMPRELLPIAISALQKYSVFYKATISDVTEYFQLLGCQGNEINTLFSNVPQDIDDTVTTHHLLIVKLSHKPLRYEILGEPHAIASLVKLSSPINQAPISHWKKLEIAEGIPEIYPETSEKFLPHEINLPTLNGVSFKKGCYTGQEIIARMEYLGKLKKQLIQANLTSESPPQRFDHIYDEKGVCGHIVDYCKIGYNEYQLLILLPNNITPSHKTLALDQQQPDRAKITLLNR